MSFRKEMIAAAIIAALLLLSLSACNSAPEAPKQHASIPEEQGPPDQTVQRVNGTPITRGSLNRAVQDLLAQKQLVRPATPEVMRQVRQEALNQLVSAELLYQAAQNALSGELDQKVARIMAQNRARHRSEAEFQKAITDQGLTLHAFQELTRKDVAIEQLLEKKFGSQAKVSEEEAKRFYEDNRGKFKTGSSVRASHILVGFSHRATPQEKRMAREKAENLLKRVKDGENFGMMAQVHSNCPSKVRGGDLGFLLRGEVDPSFERAAFSLKPGGISDIVETPAGLHIIKLTEKRGPHLESYETAREGILQDLKKEKILKMLSGYLAELRSRARLEKI